MPYEFTLTSIMPATAQEVYDAWLDSLAHTEMTGGEARMSDEIDAEVSAWDGYINGRILHLVPHIRIVQSWRTTKFGAEHEDSVVTLSLDEAEGGTLLTLVHSNVPDGQTSYERGGWETHYFEPMRAYFAQRAALVRRRAAKAAPARKAAAGPIAAKRKVEPKPEPAKSKAASESATARGTGGKRSSATAKPKIQARIEAKTGAKAKRPAPRAPSPRKTTRAASKAKTSGAKPARRN
jgi:uncharacterized protein YndB with AHSA1/START domain